jgi:predicted TIM-barrel fold metal-dependent hydrolase
MSAVAELRAALEGLPLVDHHAHGALRDDVDRERFEVLVTESDSRAPAGTTAFDSQLGFAIRRWCSPLLDLPPFAEPGAYLDRRRTLGAAEVNRRLLTAAGVHHYLVDTGWRGTELLSPGELAEVAGARATEVVRIEQVAEDVAGSGVAATDYPDRLVEALRARAATAAGLKSVVAYRFGFDFEPGRPSSDEVAAAAGRWLRAIDDGASRRLTDETLLRHGLWAGVDTGLPLQLHAGYGDRDLTLHRCDPLLLTDFVRAVEPTGVDLLLLHCYPYHRNAGYLAQVYPHVHLDVGLAVNATGARAAAVVAESLELAPFGKVLFSSDAWGPAELHYLGARLWRDAMATVLGTWVAEAGWPVAEAVRVAALVGSDNANRVYRLAEDAEDAVTRDAASRGEAGSPTAASTRRKAV